jgi:FkbM family methyltransferase
MNKIIKKYLKKWFASMGLEVSKKSIYNSSPHLIKRCADFYNIDLLIDVGANIGQYGMELRKTGFNRQLVSFEPIKEVFEKLKVNSRAYGNWHCYNFGVGAAIGELRINVAKNFESSSFLSVTELSTNAAPESQFFSEEKVSITTLDSFFSTQEYEANNIFLKIDVQGFELEVLKGINAILPKIKAIQIEMSFVPLYETGPLYREIIAYLDQMGFEVYTILPDFRDPVSGRMLQADGIFVKK